MDRGRFRAAVDWLRRPVIALPAGRPPLSLLGIACGIVITAQVGIGIARETRLGLDNLAFDVTTRPSYPDIEAAQWLRERTRRARSSWRARWTWSTTTRARVIYFPPISEPHTLMDGIRKYGVQFVVVNHRSSSYWLPFEQDCFAALVLAYPSAFHLIQEGARSAV